MENLKIGRYEIDQKYNVLNLITPEHKNGDGIYDPFKEKEILPFWGTMCGTFDSLGSHNQNYILNNLESFGKNSLDIRLEKFWIFWFSRGSLDNMVELFFIGPKAKEEAHLILHIFNSLLEQNIDRILKTTREEIQGLENK